MKNEKFSQKLEYINTKKKTDWRYRAHLRNAAYLWRCYQMIRIYHVEQYAMI